MSTPDLNHRKLPRRSPRRVYFVRTSPGVIKVGCTRSLLWRFYQLETHNNCKVEIIAIARLGQKDELAIKRRFKSDVVKGHEWLAETDELHDFIKSIRDERLTRLYRSRWKNGHKFDIYTLRYQEGWRRRFYSVNAFELKARLAQLSKEGQSRRGIRVERVA